MIFTVDGCGFDPDIASHRFAKFMRAHGFTARAQFLTFWGTLSAAQQATLIIDLLAGSMRFPDDPANATTEALALLAVP